MEENPYRPPSASVDDPAQAADSSQPPLFAVSTGKLLLMGVVTLGLYEVYWFYRQWSRIRLLRGSAINPQLRALFAVLFCYACLRDINAEGKRRGLSGAPSAVTLTAGWIAASFSGQLPGLWWVVSLGSILFLLPVQAYVNRINLAAAPQHDPNARLSPVNWAWIVVGSTFLLLGVIGTLMPGAGDGHPA